MKNVLLEVDNLFFSYGNVEVIHGVFFHVNKGEIVTIIGANGAGKSTILNTVCGLQRPKSGRILYLGAFIALPYLWDKSLMATVAASTPT